MNSISFSEAQRAIQQYLARKYDNHTFFVVIDNDEMRRKVMDVANCEEVRVSDFCRDDSFPNMDELTSVLRDAPETSNKILLGLGEALNLQYGSINNDSYSNTSKFAVLSSLMEMLVPGKLIVVCMNLYTEVQKLHQNNPKFNAQRLCFIQSTENQTSQRRIIQTSLDLKRETVSGFKKLLKKLEAGQEGDIYVKSSLPLKDVEPVNCAFDALRLEDSHFNGEKSWLSDEQWEDYRKDKTLSGKSIDHWRTFLKWKLNLPKTPYLKYVVQKSQNAKDYKTNIFNALLDFSWKDPEFTTLYAERKELLNGVTDGEISGYVTETQRMGDDWVYYLTNNTKRERQAIISWFKEKDIDQIDLERFKTIYPDLYWYLSPYHFSIPKVEPELQQKFEEYFEKYRRQKVTDCLWDDFLELVNQYSRDGSRPFNQLETRGRVLDQFDKDTTYLYWLDAMGVEFLAFIQNWAKERDLNMKTTIVRTELPTITSINNSFFTEWKEGNRDSNKALDEIKHKGRSGTQNAGYLESELVVIKEALDNIESKLKENSAVINKALLVSDHGATRLAVLNGCEIPLEMQTKGEHCGRCCPVNEINQRPDCASEEHEFWVLANYNRFKGGRKGIVEVHGGATLEEVVVPVIEFSVKSDKIVSVIENSKSIKVNVDKTATLSLFCAQPLVNATLKWNGKSYPIERQDDTTYIVRFNNVISRSGKQKAEVWENDSFINDIEFSIVKGAGKINDMDDF